MRMPTNIGNKSMTSHTQAIISVIVFLLTMNCAVIPTAFAHSMDEQKAKPPIWAVQLNWTPSSDTLQLEYDSSDPQAPMDGAYKSVTALVPPDKAIWQIHTWKLSDVDFRGRQNFGADFRLSGTPGIAVHQVIVSLQPPSLSSASGNEEQAEIVLNTDHAGGNTEKNGLQQIGVSGDKGDSLYKIGVVSGKSAEILAESKTIKYLYLYFRLNRQSPIFQAHPSTVYVTVSYAETRPSAPWSVQDFKELRLHGIRYAELLLPWGTLEPKPRSYNFGLLDETLRNAAREHMLILPIFLYSVWPGSPAPWITHYDMDSSGNDSQVPTWWNRFNRQSYFDYVTTVIRHIRNSQAFGGAFLDFGWLDYMWGPEPNNQGVNGYAPEDVVRFHEWLPTRYRSLARFDRLFKTHFTSWKDIPAATERQPLFPVYQQFRNWSVEETYGRMSALVRKETNAPLYYYWGGGLNGIGIAFNLPDIFFRVAHRYDATVVFDCADHTGLALLFNTLARVYNVKLMLEWTPRPTGLEAEMAEFMGHYGFGMPNMTGMDFFLYHGGKEFEVGYPVYVRWLPYFSKIQGEYPLQPVAVYFSYHPALAKPDALGFITNTLANMWRKAPMGFAVVTNQEVEAGLVDLCKYRAILPLNGREDPAIVAYRKHGGLLVRTPEQLAKYASPYITYSGNGEGVEINPTVNRAARMAWLTLCGWNPNMSYNGEITIHLAGLGLPRGKYRVLNAVNGKNIPCASSNGEIVTHLKISPGNLLLWKVIPQKRPDHMRSGRYKPTSRGA